jgi:hypothetical protein
MEELEREKRHALRNELMLLEVATALAFDRLFGREPLMKSTPQARDRIAHAMAALVSIYTFDEQKASIHELRYDDLRRGRFSEGGRQLLYSDGRKPLLRVAVRNADLGQAINRLRELPDLMDQLMR